MSVFLQSTGASVRDPKPVRQLLTSYAVRGAVIQLRKQDDGWILYLEYDVQLSDYSEWPAAVHRDLWPPAQSEEDEANKEEQIYEDDAWDKLYEEKGEEGFLALLRDLAPHLETTLLILLVNKEIHREFIANAWSIHPGAKEVETLDASLE